MLASGLINQAQADTYRKALKDGAYATVATMGAALAVTSLAFF